MYEVDGVFSVRIRTACGQLVFRRLQRRDQTNRKAKFWLLVKIADPTMGLQFVNLFFRQSPSVADLTVSLHVPHRSHSRNDGAHSRMAQDITQRQFSHLIKRDAELRRNVLNTLIDLLLPVTSEVIVAEIAFFERSVRCDFPSQSTFVQGYPYNNADAVALTCRKQPIFGILFEDI